MKNRVYVLKIGPTATFACSQGTTENKLGIIHQSTKCTYKTFVLEQTNQGITHVKLTDWQVDIQTNKQRIVLKALVAGTD